MSQFTQKHFIQNWNTIAKKLSKQTFPKNSKHKPFKQLPIFKNGSSKGGACCGFSFLLADYIRRADEEGFFRIYNMICGQDPKQIIKMILQNSDKTTTNELFDFVYKVYVLSENQNEFTDIIDVVSAFNKNGFFNRVKTSSRTEMNNMLHLQKEDSVKQSSLNLRNSAKQMEFMLNGISLANHRRIGNVSIFERLDDNKYVGQINDFAVLPATLNSLNEGASYEIGIFIENRSDAHSILTYKTNHQYKIFDSNRGIRCCGNYKEASDEVMLSANYCLTKGTYKYTCFDKWWDKSDIFKALSCTLLLPAMPFWLGYDAAQPQCTAEKLKKPLSPALFLNYSKIDATASFHSQKQESSCATDKLCSTRFSSV